MPDDHEQMEHWKARALEAEQQLKTLQEWVNLPENVVNREADRLWRDAEAKAIKDLHGGVGWEPVYMLQPRHLLKLVLKKIFGGPPPKPPNSLPFD